MAIPESLQRELARKLYASRMRMLCNNGFYGLLLMHLPFALDESCSTAATDGKRIYFGPKFLEGLTATETDFVLMHEVLHVVLRHINRSHIFKEDPARANVACDIVVNSNILYSNGMRKSAISIDGEVFMHVAPNGAEGYLHTAEEVYAMLASQKKQSRLGVGNGIGAGADDCLDDHSKWEELSEEELAEIEDEWGQYIADAIANVTQRTDSHGNVPYWAERYINELKDAQTDWRNILTDFIQEEIVDYSFAPPDKRYSESDFFLPDLNVDYEESVGNVLFMVDTSASISKEDLTVAYSEIKGAIDQFGGKIQGQLGFFDADITPPVPFVDEKSLLSIVPKGGGGTRFDIIFKYVNDKMEEKPTSIVILTDGVADFPPEKVANDIPVLWLINNDRITPPWGKVARVKV